MALVYEPAMYTRGRERVFHRKVVMGVMRGYKGSEEELLQLYKEFSNIVETKQYRQD